MASPALATPPQWVVDPAHSTLQFTAQEGETLFTGGFKKFTAAIAFDTADLAHSVISVTVSPASVYAGNDDRDQALPGADWFDVRQFPEARFVTTTIRQTGPDAFVAEARLTIRNVTRQVQLPFALTPGPAPDTLHAVGAVTISRHDFGVGQGDFVSDGWIKYGVKVSIDILATRKAS